MERFVDSGRREVSEGRLAYEQRNFKNDRARKRIPARMTFGAYVRKYCGWSVAGE